MRALCLLILLAGGGCIDSDLGVGGASPFTCDDGSCPNGYHCAASLCIAEGAAVPPVLIAATSLADAIAIPLWSGTAFTAIWQDSVSGDTAGIKLATVDRSMLGTSTLIAAETAPVQFSAIFEPQSRRFVVASARNDQLATELRVQSTTGAESPTVNLVETHPASPIGFSRPALAARLDGTVTLAYTRGDPPTLASQNLFCSRLSLSGGVAVTCGPKLTMSQFASEVTVVEFQRATGFHYLVGETIADIELPNGKNVSQVVENTVHTEKIININQALGSFAVVAQTVVDGSVSWEVRIGSASVAGESNSAPVLSIPSGGVVPDVDGDGAGGVVVCLGNPDGSASLVSYGPVSSDVASAGLERRATRGIPRYSLAPIESCRIAVAKETQTVGVLWRERVPPATGKLYFTTLPLFP